MTKNKLYDVLVIGGGHNGLISAAYLARAGLDVAVLERRPVVGGAAVTEEIFPGFRYSVCSYVVSLLRPEIIRELELCRHGLQITPLETSYTPLPEGRDLLRWGHPGKTRRELLKHSRLDAEIYPEFGQHMQQVSRVVQPLLSTIPPDPTSWSPTELLRLARLADPLTQVSPEIVNTLLKLSTMSAVDFLDEWFETDCLKATMSVSGIIGTYLGISSPGTAYVLLHHYMGEIDGVFRSWGFARGGNGGISESIASSARHHGATLRTQAGIESIMIQRGRAVGVVLDTGEEIRARNIFSSLDPNLTFRKLVGDEHLPEEFLSGLTRYKYRGSSGKINLAVDRLPSFLSRPKGAAHLRGDIAIAPSVRYLETAYQEAKYGAFSRRPYINMVIPTLFDPTMAPPGKHVISLFVQYAPYHLREGTWPQRREEWADTVIETLAEYVPDLKESILHRQILTPWDLEQEFGLTEGNIFHGEITQEQLFFLRPVPGWAQYRTPIRGLTLCGSGAHPGGGVMGAPGRNAALNYLGCL
ncbi:MAG: NAD(P)/FAD-dependent oxidoreductase [Planctomycetota bacterium]|jgi:phytoene dehydrogenase-like protein|nr:NAD(P)/FAD-dependent oxidoreductase [Planctomycetota bacterium]